MESAISSGDLKELFKYNAETFSDTHDKYKCTRCKIAHLIKIAPKVNENDEQKNGKTEPDTKKPKTGFAVPRRIDPPQPKPAATKPNQDIDDDGNNDDEENIDPRIPKKDKAPILPDAKQVGYPGEGDLNDWGHHFDPQSADDWVLRKAVENCKGLVSFIFSQKIDGAGLAAQALLKAKQQQEQQEEEEKKEQKEKETEPDEEDEHGEEEEKV